MKYFRLQFSNSKNTLTGMRINDADDTLSGPEIETCIGKILSSAALGRPGCSVTAFKKGDIVEETRTVLI